MPPPPFASWAEGLITQRVCSVRFVRRKIFFCSSPNFGRKIGPNLSEDLFLFFAFHLILGEKSDQI